MKKIVIFGSGGHAKVVIDMVEKLNEFSIMAVIDSFQPVSKTICGYRVLGDETSLLSLNNEIFGGVVAIGDNWIRKQVVEKIKTIIPNFKFVSILDPSSVISNSVKIGDGTVVLPGSVVNCETIIGEHCIINTNSSVDHDCILGSFVSCAPGSTIGGNVKVGDYTAIALGAKVIQSIKIGEHTVIGAGSTVVRDIESYVVAYGTPAKKIRSRKIGDKYMF
ncbi:acetyltransferase [Bacillus sp. RG28]|uniref:Acetyltransferase n=1 Tax=Gottfriedia endophytica TaxID=2820819 RepID=A0A940SJQ3_9BACI|nr:acetyltransferase [Gottfriedia endophytica]MBP0724473.1 acetyltransferase [Gottfriedia endophytica]